MKFSLKKNNYLKVVVISLLIASIMIIPQIIKGKGILTVFADFNYQQIPFSIAANNAIKSGNISYNWINDLGTSFIGSYSFYNLGSIFFIISLLFPAKIFPYLIGPLLILKYVVAALLAYIYLERYIKNKNYAVIGSLLYAFSGFQITNMLFNHFHDVVALFPLLLIALDKVMLDNKKGLFALSVAINAFTNYFFFVGQVVFLIIYFIIKLITKEYKLTLNKFFQLAIESILGVGIASIIFIPSIIFVLGNPRVEGSWSLIQAFKPSAYHVIEILRGMLFAPEIMSQRGLYNEFVFSSSELYLPFVGIILFASYMWKNKKSWITILIITSLVFMVVPILNSSFFAFNVAYYARWFYMPILIMSLATAKALDENTNLEYGYLAASLVLTAFIFVTLIFSLKGQKVVYHLSYFLMNVLISLFGYIGLYITHKFKKNKKLFTIFLITGIFLSTTISGFTFFYKYNKLQEQEKYKAEYLNNELELNYLQDGERTDSNDSMYTNLSYILNVPNLKNFNSTISGKIFEFNNSLDIERHVSSIYGEKYPKLRDFLSVRYFITRKNEVLDLKLVEQTTYFNVYENENYISMGIPYEYYISKDNFKKLDSKTKQDVLSYAIILDENQIKKYKNLVTEFDLSKLDKLNKKYKEHIKDLSNKTSKKFKYTKKGATFEISSTEEKLVVLSIPYDNGWSITINNEKVAYEDVDNGLIGIKISEGNNKVVMEYNTPGLKGGIIISILSVIFLGIYIIITKKQEIKL